MAVAVAVVTTTTRVQGWTPTYPMASKGAEDVDLLRGWSAKRAKATSTLDPGSCATLLHAPAASQGDSYSRRPAQRHS